MASYTLAELNQLILLAQRLGYQDDVDHWTAVRARCLASVAEGSES